MKNIILALLTSLFLMSPNQSFAWGLPDLPSIPGVGGGGGDLSGLESSQSKLADQTKGVLVDFLTALGLFQGALGLEADSALLEKISNCGSGKICTESDDVDRIESQAAAVTAKVEQLKKDGVKLDAAASATFASGLLPYGKGLLKGGLLGVALAELGPKLTSAVTSNPLSAPSTLAVGLALIQQIPPIISTFSDANGGIYDYATYNGIEKPEDTGPE